MGYNPKLWGSEGWYFIHFVALNYPMNPSENDKKRYLQFFQSLEHTLPCEGCAYNFGEKIKKYPPRLENRESLFKWTVDMHNSVNRENGKPEITYEKALKEISNRKDKEILKESLAIGSFVSFLFLSAILVFREQ